METKQATHDLAFVPIPAVPEIPERKHTLQNGKRRRSLPPPAVKIAKQSAASSANNVQLPPASPEVISSLISSLSAISSPAQEHFDRIPSIGESRSTPSSPSALDSRFPFDIPGFPSDSGPPTPRSAYMDARDYLHPQDASLISPLRTSKPPFGRPESFSESQKSPKDFDDVSSIGSVSIEPGIPPRESSRTASGGSDSRHSRRSHKGLMFMSSKERLRDNNERRRSGNSGADGLGLDNLGDGMHNLNSESRITGRGIREEPDMSLDSTSRSVPGSPTATSPSIGGHSPSLGGASPALNGARFIPTRDSSLRKTGSPSRKKRQSHHSSSHHSSRRGSLAPGIKEEDAESSPHDDANKERKEESGVQTDGAKEKKPKHYPPALITSEPPMKLQSPLSSPTFPPPRRESKPPALTAEAPKQVAQTAEVEERALLSEEESAPSPAIVQRKARENSTTRINSFQSRGSKLTKQGPNRKPSLDLLPGTDTSTPKRTSSRLKRISLPPSPSERHRRSNSNPLAPLGRNSESNAARPPTMVVEERPSSADSIDDAVEAYLCSPRLSQKIRHPQTGRTISFSEVGDSEGFAVFCCVGMGLTRYITAFYDELALTLKLRLITPDRPGVGDSDPYYDGTGTPLSWPDDVYSICQALKITKFSILAHSAGAIYALATALRMPQHIRGRIHLLAPWIPPSQLTRIGSQQGPAPNGSMPTSQRILRALPTPILKAANSSFMSATSSSITSSLPKSPRRSKTRRSGGGRDTPGSTNRRDSLLFPQPGEDDMSPVSRANAEDPNSEAAILAAAAMSLAEKERQSTYDERLTHAIWDLATTNANPAVDLLVCLERRQEIGFRYVDITRAVVIHHGSKDTRVPVENVRWLGKTMRRCEVRVLEGEGHGLMASAAVMGGILMEVAKEWEDWTRVVNGERGGSKVSLGVMGTPRATPRSSPLMR